MRYAKSHALTVSLALVAACALSDPARGAALLDGRSAGAPQPPRPPRGLPACGEPISADPGPVPLGERAEYDVRVLGLGVGTLEMSAERRGRFQGESVTEYRGELRPDGLVSAFVTVEGAAATLVPDEGSTPVQASHRYRWQGDVQSEVQTFVDGGRAVASRRRDNARQKSDVRVFSAPVHDVLSALLLLRRLPERAGGCAIIAANGKAFTVWVEPEGREVLDTALGKRETMRYRVRYGGDDEKKVKSARLWVGTDGSRPVYRAEALNRYHPVAELAAYQPGT